MFKYEEIEHLYALGIIPILIGVFFWMWNARKRALEEFADASLYQQLMPQMSPYKHQIKFTLLMLGLSALIIGWANPQWGAKREKVKRKSVDVFIALDISESMLATDISPNRLERAKRFAQQLVEKLKGDRIGTIIFAGNAYLQMPLTTDYAAAKLFLKTANTRMAPTQGTAISEAIDLAEKSFEQNNKQHKAMVIISDGENHDEEALARAKEARENGMLIFTVGVGTPQGSLIPMEVNGFRDYKKDKNGQAVKTTINEQMLADLAAAGSGTYFNISDGEKIITALQERISKIEKQEFETRSFTEYESYFQWFIA
ncbi:MAG TPA: VWA domain-containing protein, partial [Phaeodactylibacter sp.]|nr:VWA domain-containing protein [Phaeodactylibacter sp.]